MNFLLTQYNDSHFKLIEYKQDYRFLAKHYTTKYNNTNTNRYISNESRACSTIKELALCNDFNFFGTLTLKSDRYDLDAAQDLIKKYMKKIKRIDKNFIFLWISEKHQDGAFHFHGLFNFTNMSIFYKSTIKNQKDFKFYHGYSSYLFDEIGRNFFEPIKNKQKLSSYITKYITKTPIKSSHNQLYFCSRGLARAEKTYLKNDKLDTIFKNKNIYENDILKIIEFDLKDLTKEEIFELMYASEDDKKNVISKEVEQFRIEIQKYLQKALDFYNN